MVLLTGVPAAGLVIAGAVLSTVKARVAAGLVLPAGSVAVTLTAVGPFGNADETQLHAPDGDAVVEHKTLPLGSLTVTVLLGSAVPAMVGVVLPVVLPGAGAVMAGATGATVSTVIGTGVPAGLELPAASVATACSRCGPLASGVPDVQLHVPFCCTVAVQTSVPVG